MKEPSTEKTVDSQKPGARSTKTDGESAAIAAMPQPHRAMGERLHAIIKANAPDLSPRTW